MTCVGGGERGDSVLAALNALPDDVADDALVLVHDAARPNLCRDDLDRLIAAADANPDGAVLAAPVRDTLKRSDGESRIAATEPRAHLWRALTPQAFRRGALVAALELARADGMAVTDEAMAMERVGTRPGLVEGRDDNLKVTTPADQALVEFLLMGGTGTLSAPLSARPSHRQDSNMRIGQGFDVHAFGEGDHVMLGGVRVPHDRGVVAHSDGDVVIHALCDAMLGALALGDIGRHFPPSDERWKNADSLAFLRHCNALATERGWKLGNADVTVICERPKVGPHALAMRERLTAELGAALDAVSVKATTSEKLGFTGRGEGIAAQAVVVLLPV
jgi:2-C-methyl-D-erythritol 2,4-cyclodiphosphate synthase/2-C-methyl-D-erythritol 4-phosphate cytidylyltransferase